MGKMLGIDKIDYFAKGMGLGSRTGIDLPWRGGRVDSFPGVGASRLQAQMVCGRNDFSGHWPGRRIGYAGSGSEYDWRHRHGWSLSPSSCGVSGPVAGVGSDPPDTSPHDFPLSEETVAALKSGMWAVVNEGGGTGSAARCPGIEISGKTGTAQVVSQGLEKSAKSSEFKSTAWFVGYAPSDNPEIVVAALVQRGEHSAVAVPVVREVIRAYFDKKLGPKAPGDQMETQARIMSQLRPSAPSQPAGPPAVR